MINNKVILVFSGFNQRAVIAFLRTLRKNKLKFAIIACSKNDTIFNSDYKKNVIHTRKSIELNLDDLLDSIKIVIDYFKAEELFIAPSSEALNRFLLKFRKEFEKNGCIIPLVNELLYEKISDKQSFGQVCKKARISIPKELELNITTNFPIVAKPKNYFSPKTGKSLSPFILKSKNDLTKFLEANHKDDFYFQEFINGKSLYLLYYFYKNGNFNKYSQENLIQQPFGKSIIAAVSTNFHLSAESNKYEKLLIKLKFHGLIMIEVKQFMNTNFMIEANPRFWGPSQLFVDAGNNLFEDLLADYGFIANKIIDNNYNNRTRYFWFGGIQETLLNKNKVVFHNYKIKSFLSEFNEWLKADIYLRKDTNGIFQKEVLL